MVTGFYPADSGEILIDGASRRTSGRWTAPRAQGIVRTFQTIKLFGDMTVLEHVVIGWRPPCGTRWATAIAAARELIAFVGLSRYEETPANALAYGHRRLLEIARALAVRPKLLLLDEPAAGLVAEEIKALAGLIRRLRASGMTVLLVEHHMDLVTSISDRITVLDYGVVIADGPPAAIQRDERVIAAYLGAPHAAA